MQDIKKVKEIILDKKTELKIMEDNIKNEHKLNYMVLIKKISIYTFAFLSWTLVAFITIGIALTHKKEPKVETVAIYTPYCYEIMEKSNRIETVFPVWEKTIEDYKKNEKQYPCHFITFTIDDYMPESGKKIVVVNYYAKYETSSHAIATRYSIHTNNIDKWSFYNPSGKIKFDEKQKTITFASEYELRNAFKILVLFISMLISADIIIATRLIIDHKKNKKELRSKP